jgi:hypothetical protein
MPSERDEAADDPVIDPVLGDPRMVADPRITADRAATIFGTNREHVYWMVDQGRLPAYGSPPASSPRFPTRRRVYRQEVQALAQVRQVKPAPRPRRPVAGGQVHLVTSLVVVNED